MALLLPSSSAVHRFTGTPIRPDDDARRIDHATIDRRPAPIARCGSLADAAAIEPT